MTRNLLTDGNPFSVSVLNALINAVNRELVVDGCTVTTGSGSFETDVAAGAIELNNSSTTVASDTIDHGSAGTDDRIDLITIDDTGSTTLTKGNEASTAGEPVAPDIPADEVLAAAVEVRGGASEIKSGDIFDHWMVARPEPVLTTIGDLGTDTTGVTHARLQRIFSEPQDGWAESLAVVSGPSNPEGTVVAVAEGAVLTPSGRVVYIPDAQKTIYLFEPATESMIAGTDHSEGSDAEFKSGVLAPTGDVILAPHDSPNVGIYNPSQDSYTSGASHGEGTGAFTGAAVDPNGRVIFAPAESANVGIYNPDTDSYTSGPSHGVSATVAAYESPITLPDGRILLPNNESDTFGLFDPSDDSFSDGPQPGDGTPDWNGGVVVPDGRVVLVPNNADNVGLYDPSDDTYTSGPAHGFSNQAYAGGCLLPDGRVAMPRDGTSGRTGNLGIFDPSDDSLSDGPNISAECAGLTQLYDGRLVTTPATNDDRPVLIQTHSSIERPASNLTHPLVDQGY